MFDPLSRRLMKEGLIFLYRNRPQAAAYPVYYLPMTDHSPDDYGPVVQAMHDMAVIPWPDEKCIVVSEDAACHSIPERGISALQMFLHEPTPPDWQGYMAQSKLADIDAVEMTPIYFAVHRKGHNQVQTFKRDVVLIHRENEHGFEHVESYVERRLADIVKAAGELTEDRKQWFRDHMAKTMPDKRFWAAHDIQDGVQAQIGYATDLLTSVCNLATPCHYRVKTKFPNGFGPGPIRRITAGKPIFSFVKYDRLYVCMKEFGHGDFEVDPHFRRGHIRHHWMEAGIDRYKLPPTIRERMYLVREKHVRRTYIPPTWIGLREFGNSDTHYEVMTEEIGLT